jgi:hypothetical protein
VTVAPELTEVEAAEAPHAPVPAGRKRLSVIN